MRLTDLNPQWKTWSGRSERIEVCFDCPRCCGEKAHRVFVPFANPLDGGKPVTRQHLWQRTGDTFDTLTLTPSVDYTKYDNGTLRDPNCWHGHVTNGEVS